MKYTPYLLTLLLFWSCSTFEEDLKLPSSQVPFSELETNLPVINIVTDERDLERMLGQPTEEIEMDGLFNLYRNQQLIIANEKVELEVKGNFSVTFSLKSLGIKFDKKYDNSDRSLINPSYVLAHHNIDKIKAIRLRNSGNDFKKTMIKDLSFTQLAINANLDLDLTYGEPAIVYVNEAFYGLLNLRTEANTNGMAGLYDVKKREVTLTKLIPEELIKKDGDFDRIDRLVEAIEQNNIDYLRSEIDLNNFIDYMVFESFIGNTDWPDKNVRFHAINDGKFRFILSDLDEAAWLKMDKSPLEIIYNKGSNFLSNLFEVFYEEESFQQEFWGRYNSLLQNRDISFDKLESIVQTNSSQIRSEMPLQIDKYDTPGSMIEWDIELDKMLVLFYEREEVVRRFVE
ncbi:MAG: hypothetical protein ACI85Q_002725 [Salibacteraceae bacterium]|jgi:hypothetical protein